VEALSPPAGPVSETSAAPFVANDTARVPGSASLFTAMALRVPSDCTRKASTCWLRARSQAEAAHHVKANDAASELLVLRKRVEFGICLSSPCASKVNPTTLLQPPTLRT